MIICLFVPVYQLISSYVLAWLLYYAICKLLSLKNDNNKQKKQKSQHLLWKAYNKSITNKKASYH